VWGGSPFDRPTCTPSSLICSFCKYTLFLLRQFVYTFRNAEQLDFYNLPSFNARPHTTHYLSANFKIHLLDLLFFFFFAADIEAELEELSWLSSAGMSWER